MVDPFSMFDLTAWVEGERAAGRAAVDGAVTIEVVHPDREGEGSCRWCGARDDERFVTENGGLRRLP